MKLLFAVLFCAVLGVIDAAVVGNDCIKRYEEYDWPTEGDEYVLSQRNTTVRGWNILDADNTELSNLVNEFQNGLIVIAYSTGQNTIKNCPEQYSKLVSKALLDYPQVTFFQAFCPSPACEELNATSTISINYYFKGEHKGQLSQGLEAAEYLQKAREVFGEPKVNAYDSYSCAPMKKYEDYSWPTVVQIPGRLLRNLDELDNFVNSSKDDIIVVEIFAAVEKKASKACLEQYHSYLMKIHMDYPQVKLYQVYCPSLVCDDSIETFGLRIDYYSKEDYKGELAQGLDASEYLKKAKELFGEPVKAI